MNDEGVHAQHIRGDLSHRELAVIEAMRRQVARILRAQPAEAWQRIGIHSREGERTLEQLLEKAVDHLTHHIAFICEKRRALGVNA